MLFAVGGLAAVVGGVLLLWFRRKLVLRFSGRKTPLLGGDGGGSC